MGQPESQQSGEVGWGRTGSREEREEEQKSKYWCERARELLGAWAVPFPIHPSIQPFPRPPFPAHPGPCTAAQAGAQIPVCVHQGAGGNTQDTVSHKHHLSTTMSSAG